MNWCLQPCLEPRVLYNYEGYERQGKSGNGEPDAPGDAEIEENAWIRSA